MLADPRRGDIHAVEDACKVGKGAVIDIAHLDAERGQQLINFNCLRDTELGKGDADAGIGRFLGHRSTL